MKMRCTFDPLRCIRLHRFLLCIPNERCSRVPGPTLQLQYLQDRKPNKEGKGNEKRSTWKTWYVALGGHGRHVVREFQLDIYASIYIYIYFFSNRAEVAFTEWFIRHHKDIGGMVRVYSSYMFCACRPQNRSTRDISLLFKRGLGIFGGIGG